MTPDKKRIKQEVHDFAIIIIVGLLLLVMLSFVGYAEADVITEKAIIHHTASKDVSAKRIDQWHKERGWDGIGYHFVIRANGNIEVGRSLSKSGAHAKGRNQYVGIALTGFDTFTDLQILSLQRLLGHLGVSEIEGHHNKCPGSGINLEELSW